MIAVLMPTSSPLRFDERAAGVSRIDRGVGLDEVLEAFHRQAAPAQRRDDARGGGLAQAERVADRDHEVADLERVGIAELLTSTRFFGSTRTTAMSVPGSAPTSFAGSLRLSFSVTSTSPRVLHDVRIGHHVPVLRVDDHARAGGDLRLGLPRPAEEAPEERIAHEGVLLLGAPLAARRC